MRKTKRSEESKKLHKITVRFDGPEFSKITSEAKTAGVTVSKFVREKVKRGQVHINPYAKVDSAAINQLSKLGGQLKTVHLESNKVYSEQTAAMLREIQALILKIDSQAGDDRKTHTKPQRA
jgi:hypothetical protein